jgi:SH3-like domain-containing protein
MVRIVLAVVILGVVSAAAPAVASDRDLPRFASVRGDKAHMRTGPGLRYPVEWVYVRRNFPVEITAEFEAWRKVRDWKGTEGWMISTVLSSRRTVIVTGDANHPLHREPSATAPVIAKLDPGVIARLLACNPDWCRIEVANFRGWLPRDAFWGVRPGEKVE